MAVVAALTLAACGGGNKNNDATSDSAAAPTDWSGISYCDESDCIEIIGITDREGEQSVDLFRGQDDALLDSIAAGRTAFRSAFNVYIARGRADYDDTLSHHVILFDAGIGPQAGGQLPQRMKTAGINPADIEAVCLTHLHFDHLGWLLDTAGQVFFPNAVIYLSKQELESGRDNERWQQVLAAYGDRVKTFADGETICFDMVKTHVVPGHTPGHTIYEVGPCLIVGDLLHAQDLQLGHPDFCARYDGDPAAARQVRKQILERVATHGWYLSGAHCYEHFINLQ